jgi:DNA-binding CsgD family transcriptional regulator
VTRVTSTWARRRAHDRIEAIAGQQLDSRSMRELVLEVLREVVAFDAHIWLLTDPVTEVGADPLAVVPCLPELPALIKAKYLTPINRWTSLSTSARLHHATGGDLAQSRAWTEVQSRYDVVDVATDVFRDQFGCWGFLELWRNTGLFSAQDEDFLAELAPVLTTALRTSQARTFVPATTQRPDLGPVVLTLDDDLQILSRTAASELWLELLLPPGPNGQAVPASVYNVAAQLLANEAGVDSHPAYARTHLAGGLWLTLRAARMSGGQIVVTLQEASANDRLEVFARAVGLTPREAELLSLLAAGSSTRGMAKAMAVSENTVQDHLKVVFDKTGARDRVAVLAHALGTKPSTR